MSEKEPVGSEGYEEPLCQTTSAPPEQAEPQAGLAAPTPPEMAGLLGALGVSYGAFQPHERRYFERLRELLAFHGVMASDAPLDRTNFAQKVRTFQQQNPPLAVDGIPGPNTLWALQFSWAKSHRLPLVRVPADQFNGGGFTATQLREDVAGQYNRLRAEIKALGGIVTSSGGVRDLNAAVTPGRSPTSLHYSGAALDLWINSGMQNPTVDPFLIEDTSPRWQVWGRASGGSRRTINAAVWKNGAQRTQSVTAPVIDVTALAAKHGFRTIGSRACAPMQYICLEWWHLQSDTALVPFISQFGVELLRVYAEGDVRAAAAGKIWESRKLIFQVKWF